MGPLGIERFLFVAVRCEIMRPHAPPSPTIHQATPEEEADDNKSCHEENPIGIILQDEKKLEGRRHEASAIEILIGTLNTPNAIA